MVEIFHDALASTAMNGLLPSLHQHSEKQPSQSWDTLTTPRFQTLKFLGRGGQGFVQLALDNLHKQRVAIKYIDRGWSRGFYKYVLRETLNHQQLSLCKHPHIVEFHEVFLTPSYLAVVMEYVNGTNLQHYLETAGGKLPEDVARFIFQQLIIAVDFCHKKGKVNRDIKLANILLQEGHLPLVKLCDFGFSKDKFDDSEPQTQIGTALFTAPEIFTNVPGQVYDAEAADIWSCGVVLFVMLFGCHPFLSVEDTQHRKHAQVMKLIENAVRGNVQVPAGAEQLYPDALDLVRRILVSAPSQRCKLPAIMAHPWFQEKLPPGALLLNAAYLAMDHPVGELRQTPEEVHAIITAALSTSVQDERSESNSVTPGTGMDMASVSGMSAQQAQPQHMPMQQRCPTLLQAQSSAPPMGSSTASSMAPQFAMFQQQHHHPNLQGSVQGLMMVQPPSVQQAQPQMPPPVQHGHFPGLHAQHPQLHAGQGMPMAMLMPQPSQPLQQQQAQQPQQQPSSVHLMVFDMAPTQMQQQQQTGSMPTSSSSHAGVVTAAVAGLSGGAGSLPLTQSLTPKSSDADPLTSMHPPAPTVSSLSAAQQAEVPPNSPMLVSADGSTGKNSGSAPFAHVGVAAGTQMLPAGLATASSEPVGTATAAAATVTAAAAGTPSTGGHAPVAAQASEATVRAQPMGAGGCVLYDSSLLYNLDLQTED